ncbi:MAG: B12-binding domain-containing radical SAM protein, partial [Kiritimatiellia bacterium]
AEHRIVPLLRKVMAKETPADIPGVVMRTGDRCIMTAGEVKSCTEAGVPRTPELVRFYWEHGGIMNLQLQRGCPFSCVYCTYPILDGHRIVARDVSAAVDEMQAMYEQHGVDRFFVVDSVFNMVPARSRAFAGEIIRRKMPIQWTAYFMPRDILADDLRLWKQSGLDGIEFGVDTLCPELLTRWRKPFKVDDVLKSMAICEEVGVPHAMYLILGGPGETMETLEETVTRAGQCRKAVVFGFVGMRIYPGTDLLKLALEEGVVSATTSLMEPRFYISPLLDQARFAQRCRQLGSLHNWLVVGRSLQVKNQLAEASRKRGAKGAMWQQLSPQ